jgi:hypothetical protein
MERRQNAGGENAFGAGFSLKRPVKRGRIILMTIPMPRQLRSFDYSEPQYRVWGVIRRCISVGTTDKPEYSVGVAFTGKAPPSGYLERPSMLYDITHREDSEGFWHLQPADLMALTPANTVFYSGAADDRKGRRVGPSARIRIDRDGKH